MKLASKRWKVVSCLTDARATTASRSLVLLHATGFFKEIWSPFVCELQKKNLTCDVVAFDVRGHGDSTPLQNFQYPRVDNPQLDWWEMAEDVYLSIQNQRQEEEKVTGSLPQELIGVGHSMGASLLSMVEVKHPGTFSELVLVEPILYKPPYIRQEFELSERSLKRRNTFKSSAHLRNYFSHKPFMQLWDARCVDEYCMHVAKSVDGHLELKCHPWIEAEVYLSGASHSTFQPL